MLKAVLFDVDGTLVTFKFDALGARGALLDEMRRLGLDTTALSLSSSTQVIIDSARAQSRSRGGGGFAPIKERLYSILDSFEEESSRDAVVFPETIRALEYLRGRSLRLGVLTNSGRKAAYPVLRRGGIFGFFEFVISREDVDAMKPSPEGILLALERFDVDREDLCYVGDGLLDVAAAKAAGVRVVSVATGTQPADRLRQEGADVLIRSLDELPGAIGV
jgi:HAD superfamily hydrolase (TIGR01549 family)